MREIPLVGNGAETVRQLEKALSARFCGVNFIMRRGFKHPASFLTCPIGLMVPKLQSQKYLDFS